MLKKKNANENENEDEEESGWVSERVRPGEIKKDVCFFI